MTEPETHRHYDYDDQTTPRAQARRKKSSWKDRHKGPLLPLWKRVLLLMVGWILILLGVVGLVLPGLQGILTLFAGAAVLSLVSEVAYELLRKVFRRWPKGWRRVSKLRRRMQLWLHRKGEPS